MITETDFKILISEFDLGTSTAEKDPLLEIAKIETQEFEDIYIHDRIDIIKGIKGSGKTAIYRLFYFIKDILFEKKNTLAIFGVEHSGDPVFIQFRKQFELMTEIEFQNFWTMYVLSLIRNEVKNNKNIIEKIDKNGEFTGWLKGLHQNGLPEIGKTNGMRSLIESILGLFKSLSSITPTIGMEANPNGTYAIKPGMKFEFDKENLSNKPIYTTEIMNELLGILKSSGIKIWVFLDRLDEVFIRRTKEEELGLKGLLRAAYNFTAPELRMKIFIREDIITQISNSPEGFTALTHVTDRCSSTMSWSRENILHLIIKRIFTKTVFSDFFKIDSSRIDKDSGYRSELFNKIFPLKIGKSSTFEWMYVSLSDGNGVVTPRDVIDLMNFAKSEEYKDFNLNKGNRDFLIQESSFIRAFELLSVQKRNKYLMAEFPHFKDQILQLEGGYSIYSDGNLQDKLGKDYKSTVSNLKSIGLLEYNSKKVQYTIPKLFRKGLSITHGRTRSF